MTTETLAQYKIIVIHATQGPILQGNVRRRKDDDGKLDFSASVAGVSELIDLTWRDDDGKAYSISTSNHMLNYAIVPRETGVIPSSNPPSISLKD